MSESKIKYDIMSCQAQVHKLKSEYATARNIHWEISKQATQDKDNVTHVVALINIAEIDVVIDHSDVDVQHNVDAARTILSTIWPVRWWDAILADLFLRDGDPLAAKALFLECIKSAGMYAELLYYCLEPLGDASRWDPVSETLSWTTILLAHSLKHQEKLLIHKALLSFGQMFHNQEDEDTAMSLFNVALEGFTQMDVHQSRGECMLHLGDIHKGRGDLLKAVELWDTARPRSSQDKRVKKIDERVACMGKDLLEQHRKSLALLADLSAPSGIVEEQEEDLSDDVEDLDIVEKEEVAA
ncbi:hypothetical protein C8R47DRAFT_1076446 [Mycena vitilis]|nr:hypothetical protein C8R47DRAFT_1076446 [Mycena vitilis]